MSRASKLTLLGTSLFAVGTVVMVHFQQEAEKRAMHQGVVRDLEQQRIKRERQLDFDMQKALEAEYLKEQNVRDVTSEMRPHEEAASGFTTSSASPPDNGAKAEGGTKI